jgi:hypothetical protein
MTSPADLVQLLTSTLSPDGNARISAELALNQVLATEGERAID